MIEIHVGAFWPIVIGIAFLIAVLIGHLCDRVEERNRARRTIRDLVELAPALKHAFGSYRGWYGTRLELDEEKVQRLAKIQREATKRADDRTELDAALAKLSEAREESDE